MTRHDTRHDTTRDTRQRTHQRRGVVAEVSEREPVLARELGPRLVLACHHASSRGHHASPYVIAPPVARARALGPRLRDVLSPPAAAAARSVT